MVAAAAAVGFGIVVTIFIQPLFLSSWDRPAHTYSELYFFLER